VLGRELVAQSSKLRRLDSCSDHRIRADDPLVFKKLIYEMRFDEASAKYAAFGQFYSGIQFSLDQLPVFLGGTGIPALELTRTLE